MFNPIVYAFGRKIHQTIINKHNKQPSFIVKNPRTQFFEIDHVIWTYQYRCRHDRSLNLLNIFLFVLTHGLKMAESSINSNPQINE